jgi:hypothetical protein
MARHIRGTGLPTGKLNYKWWAVDLDGGVYETPEAVDEESVYATFTEARQALGDHFAAVARRYDDARYLARKLRKAGMKNGEVTL